MKSFKKFMSEIAVEVDPSSDHVNKKRCPKHDWESIIDGNHIRNHKTTGKLLGVGHLERCKVCGKERTVDYDSRRLRK